MHKFLYELNFIQANIIINNNYKKFQKVCCTYIKKYF